MTKNNQENKKELKKIMLFGTFDGVHKGHLNLFKQAREICRNSFLIVSIARDKNVLKIKGKKPFNDEKNRKKLVEACGLVDKVILGGSKDYLVHIVKENPDIIALGYDQVAYVGELNRDLKNQNKKIKIVRLKPYQESIYKNSLLNK